MKINRDKARKACGVGAAASLAFLFGFLKIALGILGVSTLVLLDRYGHYLFLPAYSFFSAIFIGSLSGKRTWLFYILTIASLTVAAYFASFGFLNAGILLGGFIVGGYSFRFLK